MPRISSLATKPSARISGSLRLTLSMPKISAPQRAAGQHKAERIEAAGRARPAPRSKNVSTKVTPAMPIWQVDVEDPPPRQICRQQAAKRRADHQRAQARPGDKRDHVE